MSLPDVSLSEGVLLFFLGGVGWFTTKAVMKPAFDLQALLKELCEFLCRHYGTFHSTPGEWSTQTGDFIRYDGQEEELLSITTQVESLRTKVASYRSLVRLHRLVSLLTIIPTPGQLDALQNDLKVLPALYRLSPPSTQDYQEIGERLKRMLKILNCKC